MMKLIQRSLYYCGWFFITLHLDFPPVVLAAISPNEVMKQDIKITKCRDGEKLVEQGSKLMSKCRVSAGKISGCATRCILYQSGMLTKDYRGFVSDSKLVKNAVKFQGMTEKTAKKFVTELKKANCKGKVPKPSECSKYEAVIACAHTAFRKVC